MDVLFKSIDVRELLSSQELEESSPLSAPDLRLLIDRLQIRSVHIKSKVQNYILSHHAHFASLFSLSSDVVSTSEQVAAQLSDLVASDRPIDLEIGRVVGEIGKRRREVGERKEEVELVRAVLEVVEMVEEVRGEIREGRVVEAAEKVRELKAAMGRGICEQEEEERGREPVVYGLLRKEWNDCFDQIQEVIARFMENAVSFDKDMNAIHVKYQSSVNGNDGVELRRILEAMDVVGIMDYGIAKVADLMIKYVITPVISSGSPTSLSEELKQDSEGHITEVILKILPSVDPKVKDVDGGTIYSASIQAVKFICNSLCFQNNEWAQCFGRLTWPRMSELIISNFLSKVVPDDASKLAEFEKIVLLTSQFESDLKEMMFISSSDDNDRRLSAFANNVEVHFASRKKIEILARARNLLLQSDFVLPKDFTIKTTDLKNEKNGENGFNHVVNLLFSSESCVVSGAASQLMELVHQTLKDVCLLSTRVALEFYHAARDALLLYEAIVPVKLERQLDGINQVAVLIHNDCLYLSREILGLAFEYRSDFPSPIKELAVFVDLAPRFQLMAKEILRRQVEVVIHNLKEAMDGADGFQNTHQIKQFESAKFSVDQVIFILEKVHIIWEPLLLPSTYRGCMCMVLEAVFSRTAKDILLLDDMAAEETLQLQRLIHLMLESLSSLLESLIALTVKWKSPEGLSSSIDDFIPSLRKLRKLAELLDMPLRSITAAWEGGELVSCGFTSSEVVDFIKAIFTDSPLRKECLWRIHNNDFEKF